MTVEITLFGFGDHCPSGFKHNKREIHLDKTEKLDTVLRKAGFADLQGLVLLVNNQGVASEHWSTTRIHNNDSIKVLSAIEGG